MADNKDDEMGGCPIHKAPAAGEPGVYGRTDLTYNSYLMVPDLLKLQVAQSDPAHHDEMLFIVIHQTYELWFKLILHELENAIAFMGQKKVLRAHHFIKRVVEIMKVLVRQIHILETMTPVEFLAFREKLNPASGFQSLQFREIEFLAGLKDESYSRHFRNRPEMLEVLEKRMKGHDLRSAFYDMLIELKFPMPKNASELERKGGEEDKEKIIRALLPIYQEPDEQMPLYLLAESMVELDEHLSLWREHHVRVVERVIGFKRGTGGSSGSEYLRSTTSKKCFPYLWEVRTYLEKPASGK